MRYPVLVCALAAAAVLATAAGSGRAAGRFSDCPGGGYTPVWSPDGHEVAWSTWLGSEAGICFARSDGSHQRFMSVAGNLSTPTEILWVRPTVLVVLTDADQLFSVSTQPEPHVVRYGPRFAGPGGLTFSLDVRGTTLATGSDGAGPVHVMRLGGLRTSVGDGAYLNYSPSLSPDGRRVVFAKQEPGAGGQSLGIWTAGTDGTHVHEIEPGGRCPLWSPAGNRIAYFDGGLVLVPTTGGAGIMLATGANELCGEPQSIAWSPDGRRIAFADAKNHLSIVDVRTKRVWTVRESRDLHGFAWSPDSRQLFFSAGNTRDCKSLWRAAVNGTETVRVSRC